MDSDMIQVYCPQTFSSTVFFPSLSLYLPFSLTLSITVAFLLFVDFLLHHKLMHVIVELGITETLAN